MPDTTNPKPGSAGLLPFWLSLHGVDQTCLNRGFPDYRHDNPSHPVRYLPLAKIFQNGLSRSARHKAFKLLSFFCHAFLAWLI
jgi:hypothetical protein